MPVIDPTEKAIINGLQGGFPLTPRPFRDAGAELGLSEDELLEGVRDLVGAGQLSRFGPLWNAEMLGDLPDLLVAERGLKLLRRNRQVAAIAEPRLDLRTQSVLLELVHDPLHVAEVRLGQYRRDQAGGGGRGHLADHAAKRAADIIEKSHRRSPFA